MSAIILFFCQLSTSVDAPVSVPHTPAKRPVSRPKAAAVSAVLA